MKYKKILMREKNGLSSVVATLLIVLLSIIALTMVYSTVNNIMNSIKTSPTLTCSDFQFSSPIEIVSSCYDTDKNEINIQIRRSFSNLEFNDLKFVFTSSSTNNIKTYSCAENICGCSILNPGEIKNYRFKQTPEDISSFDRIYLKVNECDLINKEVTLCQKS